LQAVTVTVAPAIWARRKGPKAGGSRRCVANAKVPARRWARNPPPPRPTLGPSAKTHGLPDRAVTPRNYPRGRAGRPGRLGASTGEPSIRPGVRFFMPTTRLPRKTGSNPPSYFIPPMRLGSNFLTPSEKGASRRGGGALPLCVVAIRRHPLCFERCNAAPMAAQRCDGG
jgi:hypothetical protein